MYALDSDSILERISWDGIRVIAAGEEHSNSPARGHPSPAKELSRPAEHPVLHATPYVIHTHASIYIAGGQRYERGGVVSRTYHQHHDIIDIIIPLTHLRLAP